MVEYMHPRTFCQMKSERRNGCRGDFGKTGLNSVPGKQASCLRTRARKQLVLCLTLSYHHGGIQQWAESVSKKTFHFVMLF